MIQRYKSSRLAHPFLNSPTPYYLGWATLFVILSNISFGTVPYFAKNLTDAGIAPAAIAFYRFALTSIILSPFLKLEPQHRRTTLVGIGGGMAMGLGWIAYVAALKTLPVSTVGVIYMTYPAFTLLIGWIVYSDRPKVKAIIASGLILLASVIALSPASLDPTALWPALLAFLAPIGFGIAINNLTRVLVKVPPFSRIASVALGSVIGIGPLMFTYESAALLPATANGWWLIVGIALIGALIPQLIYTTFAPMIGSARSAMAGAVELPTVFFVGWWAFGEAIGWIEIIAGSLVIISILLTPAEADEVID